MADTFFSYLLTSCLVLSFMMVMSLVMFIPVQRGARPQHLGIEAAVVGLAVGALAGFTMWQVAHRARAHPIMGHAPGAC